MKKTWIIGALALLLGGCSSSSAVEKSGTGTYTNAKGEVTTANIKMEDDKLVEVSIDETAKDKDKTKKELGNAYDMKQASGIGKEWYEQIDFLEGYIEKNGLDKIKVNEEGKATNDDVLAGCTISIEGFIKAIQDAEKNVK